MIAGKCEPKRHLWVSFDNNIKVVLKSNTWLRYFHEIIDFLSERETNSCRIKLSHCALAARTKANSITNESFAGVDYCVHISHLRCHLRRPVAALIFPGLRDPCVPDLLPLQVARRDWRKWFDWTRLARYLAARSLLWPGFERLNTSKLHWKNRILN